MSSCISRIASLSLFLFVPLAVLSQSGKKKMVVTETDTIPLFRGVAVSADAVGALQMALGSYGQYEAALRVNLKDKYYPIVELGLGKADAENVVKGMSYKTSAPYGRVGLDFNLLKNKHDDYRLYAGGRYAYTSYKYDAQGSGMKDPVWGEEVPFEVRDVKCSYHWLEMVVGVDAKIAGPVRLGWSLRYKRRLIHDDGDMGNTWYVPGYGKQGNTRLGGTFNLIFEL
ncbi:MAG: DUF6048 family protein [Prevotella sp.]